MATAEPAPTAHPPLAKIIRLPAAGLVLLLFAMSTLTWTDTDLWGHTRFGLDILRDHDLPSVDPYSFTQDKPWVNHEWLSELQMGIAYHLAGPTGLALLKGTLTFAALVLMWGALRGVDPTARIIIFAVAAASTVPVTRTLRPQAWSLVLLAILCRILVEDRRRARWWAPVLLALWANLHGGWIVGLGILSVWTICDVVTWRFGELTTSPVVSTVILLATLVSTLGTPYGPELWQFLVETVRMGRDITEWRPLWRQPPPDWIPWAVTVAASVWLLRRPLRFRLHVAAVIAMLAYSSFRVMRIAPLFVACAVILLSPWFRARWPARPGHVLSGANASARGQWALAWGLFAALIIAAAWVGSRSLGCVRTEGTWIPDRVAAQVFETAPPGRVVTFFNWGEYALWHFGPRLRVSMDGRRETVYSDARLDDHDGIIRGTAHGFARLAEWRAEYAWLPSRSAATRAWLLEHGYVIDKETDRSFVARRADLPPLTVAGPAQLPGAACFPD
jgi:hypothetical protein